MISSNVLAVEAAPLQAGTTTNQMDRDYFDENSRTVYITQSMIEPSTAKKVKRNHIKNDHVRFYKYRFNKDLPSEHAASVQSNPTEQELTDTHEFVSGLKKHLLKVARDEIKRRFILLAQSKGYRFKRMYDSQLVSSFPEVRASLQTKEYELQYKFIYIALFPTRWDSELEQVVMTKAGVKYRPGSRGANKNKDCIASLCSTAADQVRKALSKKVKRRSEQEVDEDGKKKRRRNKTKFSFDPTRMIVDLTEDDSQVQSHPSLEKSANLQKKFEALEAHIEGGGTIETIEQFQEICNAVTVPNAPICQTEQR